MKKNKSTLDVLDGKPKSNKGQPDPITNRRMSDDCWNSRHWGQTVTRMDTDGVKRKYDIGCVGWMDDGKTQQCECHCHSRLATSRVSKQDQAAQTMSVMESGCGTIEIK